MKLQISSLARDLCAIPSITNQECEVLSWLEIFFEKYDFTCEKIHVNEKRYNLFVYAKKQELFNIVFCTHIDTVGAYIKPELDLKNQILRGRGSCDAKGIAASMIFTLFRQLEKNYHDIALLLTVGEEFHSDGAKAANKYLAKKAKYVVVGEPTNLKMATGQKGMLVFDIIAQGRSAHSSLPDLGHSAIHELILCLESLVNTSWPNSDNFGDTYINIGEIVGGSGRNIISSYAQAKIIMRLGVEPEIIINKIKKNMSNKLKLKILSQSSPVKFHTLPNIQNFCAGFGSDAPYLDQVGKIMLCGPGDLAVAHTDHEYIKLVELEKACDIYEYICEHTREKTYEY